MSINLFQKISGAKGHDLNHYIPFHYASKLNPNAENIPAAYEEKYANINTSRWGRNMGRSKASQQSQPCR